MGYRQPDFEDEWEGLEPEQPEGSRWILWLGSAVVILFLIGICLIGGYLLVQQFQRRTTTPAPIIVPTSPVDTPTAAPISTATATTSPPEATATDAPLAPTATSRPTVTTAPTETPPSPAAAGQVTAARLSTPPSIDGDLSEWTGQDSYESAFQVFNAGSWDGTDDVRAAWQLGWDAGHLYIAVVVEDDTHVQTQSGNQIFRGDSLDMQFDTDRNGDFGDGLSPDDFQIIFSPGDFTGLPPSAFRFQGTSGGRILDAPGGNSVTVAAIPTAAGYQLEAAIPWSDLNLVPASGLVIGLALNVNDNDSPGTAMQEVMKSHIATRTLSDPTTWGTLLLE